MAHKGPDHVPTIYGRKRHRRIVGTGPLWAPVVCPGIFTGLTFAITTLQPMYCIQEDNERNTSLLMKNTHHQPDNILPGGMSRREFMTLCALGTLPGVLISCQSTPSQTNVATPSGSAINRTPTQQPSPTQPPAPTSADWSALAGKLQGTLVRPGNAQYPVARQLFIPRFDTVMPQA